MKKKWSFPGFRGYEDFLYEGEVGNTKLYRSGLSHVSVVRWDGNTPYIEILGKETHGVMQQHMLETFHNLKAASKCHPIPGALKYDGEKPMMDLLFDGMPSALFGVGTVLTYGFKKYGGKHGWKHLDDAIKRYEAAMIRHMLLKSQGEVFDLESKFPHAWHIACNALFITELEAMKGTYNGSK